MLGGLPEDVFQMVNGSLLQMTQLRPRELEVLTATVLLCLPELATDSSSPTGFPYLEWVVGAW